MVFYFTSSLKDISADNLTGGFFVGWPNPPSPENHLRILQGSYAVELAICKGQVVGYVTAISDGVSTAYIPQLEVLPEFQGQGIGTKLMDRLMGRLTHLYAIDLLCDEDKVPYYEKLGMTGTTGALKRHYNRQSCD